MPSEVLLVLFPKVFPICNPPTYAFFLIVGFYYSIKAHANAA